MKIKLSKASWEAIGHKAGWGPFGNPKAPQEGQYGNGLDEEAMGMLKQYDITAEKLFRYDSATAPMKDIYEGIQAAKQGNNSALLAALEARFGKKNFWQKKL